MAKEMEQKCNQCDYCVCLGKLFEEMFENSHLWVGETPQMQSDFASVRKLILEKNCTDAANVFCNYPGHSSY